MDPLARLESHIERISAFLSGPRSDLSARQIRAFLMIAKASLEGEPINQEDLTHFLGMPKQSACDTVKRFVDLKLLDRVVSKTDRRAKCLVLTESGRNFASSLSSDLEHRKYDQQSAA